MNDPLQYHTGQLDAGLTRSLRVVYHNNGGLPDQGSYLAALLTSLRNHVQAIDHPRYHAAGGTSQTKPQIIVVSHGKGLALFELAHSDEALRTQLDGLRQQQVQFLVCANSLRSRAFSWQQLYRVREEDIVPSGVAELAWLQQQGFAYLHL